MQAFVDAGLLPGVLNLVFGKPSDISEYLIPQLSVRLVTYPSVSVPVGKCLFRHGEGVTMKPVIIMELAGHGAGNHVQRHRSGVAAAAPPPLPSHATPDRCAFLPTRFFVEDAIYDRLADAFAQKARTIKVGNGLDPDNQMGPLANERRLAAMETLVADAKAKGHA